MRIKAESINNEQILQKKEKSEVASANLRCSQIFDSSQFVICKFHLFTHLRHSQR